MADGFDVLTGELGAHAGRLDALTERLRTAVDAASQVTMNNEAYGVVCQPFAMLLQPFEQMGVNALRQGTETLSENVRKVKDTVTRYDTTDSGEAATFRGVEL